MSSNQCPSSKYLLFERLEQLHDILYFPETSIDIVEILKWEFQFMDFFLRLQRFIDEPDMLEVTQQVQDQFEDALVDLSELYLAEYFDFYTCKVQTKILLTKIEIRARYSFPKVSLPISANKDGDIVDILKLVTEFVHSVAENLPELVKIDDPYSLLYFPLTMEHVKDVLKELELLSYFSCFVSERLVEPHQISQHDVVDFFTHVVAVTGHTSMLFWLYIPDLAPEEINVVLSDILRMRIKPIQPCIRKIYVDVLLYLKSTILQSGWCPHIQNEHAEANFLETILHNLLNLPSNGNSSQKVALKDHLVILQKMLNLLKANINSVPTQDLQFLRAIDTVIIDVGLLVYSLYNGEEEEKEGMAPGEVTSALALDLLGNTQRTSTVICLTIRKAFQFNLPRIHGLGYIDILLNNLKMFRSSHSDSLASALSQLQIVQKEFESLQPFLEALAEERCNDFDKIQHCAKQLISKAYEVEYMLDACISKEAPIWCLERWLLDIMEEITLIKVEVAESHEKKMIGYAMNTDTAHTSSNSARSPRYEEIVGFEDVIENLRDQLIKGTCRGRDVIAIVGMPGLGKTTLAYRLYSDNLVVSHFDIRAQFCVSQVYSRKNLLLAILRDVIGEDPKHREKHEHQLADELRKALFSKRYLILVDDVWELSAWDDIVGCFHDANNGSRVILTTRNHEVANYARFQSEPLPLRMFSDDESWELLQKKVFGEEGCPPQLRNIGQQIAKQCGGLPLSVALVAGILEEMEKQEECWEQVANNLGPHIHKDSTVIIAQSYDILPYHLRSCFLYFGAFLEDTVINVSKLIRLWISEGFIKSHKGKSLEDIAEGYLENLIGRNLVLGTKRNSAGNIKACHIHDLVHDFCKERAKEENFLLCLKWNQNVNPSSSKYYNKQLTHRVSIYDEGYHIGEWSPCWSHVGSVMLHTGYLKFDIVYHIVRSFKFLKVLDLESTNICSFPTNLVYLRYFAAKGQDLQISSFITNCCNLETLILINYSEELLPVTFLEMVKLRNLHIAECSFTKELLLDNSKILHDLKTLSTPHFSCVQDAELILRKTPNLRELRCLVKGIDNFQYCVLNFPTQIETLKIESNTFQILPFCISAPNLKKLTLEVYTLHPRHISEIGSLQNLQVLKLRNIFFTNKGWTVRNGEFPQLKVLKLHRVDFPGKKWVVADEAFPNLERLVLFTCYSLKEIPSCFGEISSLKSIEVEDCEESVGKSARDIWETQVEDYQNTGFKVSILNGETDYFYSGYDDDGDSDSSSDDDIDNADEDD